MKTTFNASGSFGHFDIDRREYVITTRQTPRPWINYIWNERCMSLVTNTAQGFGFHMDENSNRTDHIAGRRIYLQNPQNGVTWNADGMDGDKEPTHYECRHGLGYTIIQQIANGIESTLHISLPSGISSEVWKLTLKNTTDTAMPLRVVGVLDSTIDGDIGLQGYYTPSECHFEKDLGALVSFFDRPDRGITRRAFFSTDAKITGVDTRHDAFFGPFHRDGLPKAIRDGQMGNSECCEAEKLIFALETQLKLEPGETQTLHFFAGHFQTLEADGVRAQNLLQTLETDCVRAQKNQLPYNGLEIETGNEVFDQWCNTWLMQQIRMNATWARGYFYGYRDMLQDSENLTVIDTDLPHKKMCQALSYQYPSGYAPRAWLQGKALDHGHSDSPVWIVYTVHALLLETGNLALLDETVPYYETDSGSIYDHCKRAMDWFWNDRGENGLCLFRKGDWNDAMVEAGKLGKGTSTWTTMAYLKALHQFAELAEWSGKPTDATEARSRAAEIKRILNDVAWDGAYYLRGFTDHGDPIGSSKNNEGTMYLNAQSWAILSGAADPDRAQQIMTEVGKHLDTPTGAVTIKDPYSGFNLNIGMITGQRPGAYQNQSVYCHSNTFKMAAECALGDGEAAWRTLEKILPFSNDRCTEWGEPFVLPNSYYGPACASRHDQPGQSWITATAGWVLMILVRDLFGLKPKLDGLHIAPCLPRKLANSSLVRRFRRATYNVRYSSTGTGKNPHVESITVDGYPLDGTRLPHQPNTTYDVQVHLS